jgi:hypothetical protein
MLQERKRAKGREVEEREKRRRAEAKIHKTCVWPAWRKVRESDCQANGSEKKFSLVFWMYRTTTMLKSLSSPQPTLISHHANGSRWRVGRVDPCLIAKARMTL